MAVYDIVKSAFGHAGQKCSAGSLAIVEKEIYNNPLFFKQLVDATNSLSVGNPTNLGKSVGPIIKDPDEKLLRALTELEEGEEWLVKPEVLSNSNCWTPGIKINVQPNSWTHMNEWFGPVLGIMQAPNLKKAIEWQNATEYGLTAGLHSLSTKECNYWLKNVEAGNLYINRPITGAIVKRQPFGGWKKSSFGPTVKAGSSFYPRIFRRYDEVKNYDMLVSNLEELWNIRNLALPYKNSYEALILASIIEKEGVEKRQIAGVFIRRLQIGMKLQSDPTIIYALGKNFDGDIKRSDITMKHPYNTYHIKGLPPGPIGLVSKSSIEAAINPAEGTSLYFVAKGDGTHHFSDTLKEHNQAVRKYQLNK